MVFKCTLYYNTRWLQQLGYHLDMFIMSELSYIVPAFISENNRMIKCGKFGWQDFGYFIFILSE